MHSTSPFKLTIIALEFLCSKNIMSLSKQNHVNVIHEVEYCKQSDDKEIKTGARFYCMRELTSSMLSWQNM
jgi:hypothetical protein